MSRQENFGRAPGPSGRGKIYLASLTQTGPAFETTDSSSGCALVITSFAQDSFLGAKAAHTHPPRPAASRDPPPSVSLFPIPLLPRTTRTLSVWLESSRSGAVEQVPPKSLSSERLPILPNMPLRRCFQIVPNAPPITANLGPTIEPGCRSPPRP